MDFKPNNFYNKLTFQVNPNQDGHQSETIPVNS